MAIKMMNNKVRNVNDNFFIIKNLGLSILTKLEQIIKERNPNLQ